MDYLPAILGLLPGFAWLIFYLEEDPHPEPKKMIFETFLMGAASTILVLGFQMAFNDFAEAMGIISYTLVSFLALSGIEEFFKFGAAWLVINKHPREFDEPVDAMIYLVVAALGFATIENIAAAFNASEIVFETTTLRFIGATLLHTLSSGILGYYWARSIVTGRIQAWYIGFIIATVLHAIFNYLIIIFEPVVIPTTFLIIFALFVLYDFEKLKRV